MKTKITSLLYFEKFLATERDKLAPGPECRNVTLYSVSAVTN